jgi:hypothetical protein
MQMQFDKCPRDRAYLVFFEAWVSAQAAAELGRLPRELADRRTKPFANFLRIEAAAGVVLLSFAVTAVILSNSSWAEAFLQVWETRVGLEIGLQIILFILFTIRQDAVASEPDDGYFN